MPPLDYPSIALSLLGSLSSTTAALSCYVGSRRRELGRRGLSALLLLIQWCRTQRTAMGRSAVLSVDWYVCHMHVLTACYLVPNVGDSLPYFLRVRDEITCMSWMV